MLENLRDCDYGKINIRVDSRQIKYARLESEVFYLAIPIANGFYEIGDRPQFLLTST
jgi:hypothetical protein